MTDTRSGGTPGPWKLESWDEQRAEWDCDFTHRVVIRKPNGELTRTAFASDHEDEATAVREALNRVVLYRNGSRSGGAPAAVPRTLRDYATRRIAALSWLTLKTQECAGCLSFSMTENGDVGLFEGDIEAALGTGDTCEEALIEAHDAYHKQDGLAKCECANLAADGDVLP